MKVVSVNSYVSDLMQNYDLDKNGIINLNTEAFVKENKLFGKDTYTTSKFFEDVNVHTRANGDISREKLYYYVKSFDLNNDGQLSKRSFFDKLFRKPKGELDELETQYSATSLTKNSGGFFNKILSFFRLN